MQVFITGTDTGIGKTIVTTGLALALKNSAYSFSVFKAIETGCNPEPHDTLFYKNQLGLEKSVNEICPIQLKNPLAPSVASEIEFQEISLNLLINEYHKQKQLYDYFLVEGAGGLLVPILDGFTMADLALILNLPIVIIVGNKLGAINHALLTYHYAQAKGLRILAVLLNPLYPDLSLAEKTNLMELNKYIQDIPLMECPFVYDIHNKLSYLDFQPIAKRIFNL